MKKQLVFAAVFLLSANVSGQSGKSKIKSKRAEIDSSKVIEVKFGNPLWNKDPSQIDSGVVILRDSKSKKTMQVLLEETAPDSSVYSGTYSINWGGNTSVQPEVYVLKEDQLISQAELQKVMKDIESGALKRKPLFYRKGDAGVQTLEVFNNRDQAVQALNLLRAQREQTNKIDTSSITSKDLSAAKAAFDANELAKFATENEQRKKDSQARLVDRFRMEQAEKEKLAALKKEQAAQSQDVREKKKLEAVAFAETALDLYKAGNYTAAEENFKKSFELDPSNTKYYFQYGLSLYKNQKYNEAIVAFNIAKTEKDFALESIYYTGLCQYSLKEYELALSTFAELKKKNDEKLSPLASFYSGLSYFDQKAYPKSKEEFQEVLDTSKDPRLDDKAEAYIESIDRLIAYAKNKAKKFFLSGSLGTMYDSNVLALSDSSADQGTATDEASLRYIIGLGIYYRPVFTKNYEFGPKIRTDYIFTQEDESSDYDPWSTQITAPFSAKSVLWKKSYKLDLKPGYEVLYLGQDDTTGKPEKSLKAVFFDWGNTFVMRDHWISTYTLSYRKEDFYQDGDQGKNGSKITLKWTNLYFTNKEKTKGIVADLGYSSNSTDEDIYTYKRIDLSALYLTPMFKEDITFAGGLALYKLDYSGQDRSDFNKTLNLTLTKPLSEQINGTLLGSYVLNGSDVESSEYDKWTIGVLFSAELGF